MLPQFRRRSFLKTASAVTAATCAARVVPAWAVSDRGIVATSDEEKIRRFKETVRLDPAHTLAMLQLAKTYYAAKDYASALEWLAKIPAGDPSGN